MNSVNIRSSIYTMTINLDYSHRGHQNTKRLIVTKLIYVFTIVSQSSCYTAATSVSVIALLEITAFWITSATLTQS